MSFMCCLRFVMQILTSQRTHLPSSLSKTGASRTLLGSPCSVSDCRGKCDHMHYGFLRCICQISRCMPDNQHKFCVVEKLKSYLQFQQLCAQYFCGFVNAHSLMHPHCHRSYLPLKLGMQQTHAVVNISNNSMSFKL